MRKGNIWHEKSFKDIALETVYQTMNLENKLLAHCLTMKITVSCIPGLNDPSINQTNKQQIHQQ